MNEKGVKRKKKSFFQKSKKYYKKGIQGKGIRIDEESFEYFLHVLKVMNQEFESEDDKSKILITFKNCKIYILIIVLCLYF